MDSGEERWDRVVELFAAASEMPAGEREAWVRTECGPDPSLGAEVLSLLDAAAAERAAASRVLVPPVAEVATERRYGPWETVRLLGTGGMGSVLLVRRADGEFEQEAALKLIAPHLAGPYFLERFRAERQILAHLQHPNITKLLDGGVTSEGGAPYLVMEYVKGEPLDQYTDSRRLAVRERLHLFLKICAAVEYAHRNLVVHRDLKPSNIFVDEAGEPKLLDFGTARLLPEAGEDDSITLFRFVTPRYASPEALHHGPVTTQADVFSLGVLLYEQITGARPFGDSPVDVMRRITAGEMSPPEKQITEAGAAARSVSVRELSGLAGGDLAKILEKATRAELSERYGSVAELADDLRAYLEGRPVRARAATAWYVARKFLRRNWLPVTMAALMSLSLAGAAVYSRAQAQIAQRRFLEVRQMANYLVGDIHGGLQRIPGSTPLQREVVERSMRYLDELARESQGDLELQLQVVEGYQKLGDVLGNPYRSSLGDSRAALETYAKALQTLEPVLRAEPTNPRARRAAALLRLHQAGTKGFGGAAREGFEQIEVAVADLRRLVAERPRDEAARLEVAAALEFQGNRLGSGGGTIEPGGDERVDRLYAESMGEVDVLLAVSPGRPAVVRQAALTGFGAALLWGSSDPVRSIRYLRQVETRISELPEVERRGLDMRKLQANVYYNLGFAQGQIREYASAISNLGRAEEFVQVWVAVDPANTSARYLLSGVYRARGLVHSYAGENDAAAKYFLAAAETHRKLLQMDPENRVYRYLRGEMLVRSGNLLVKAGKPAEAKARTAEGLALIRQLALDPKPAYTHLFGACRWLVECEVRELRNPALAARYCEQMVVATEEKDPDAWMGLSQARALMGDRPGALAAAERALKLVPAPQAGEPASRQRTEMEASRNRLR